MGVKDRIHKMYKREEKERQRIADIKAGLTCRQLAEKWKMKKQSVWTWAKSRGLTVTHSQYTSEKIAKKVQRAESKARSEAIEESRRADVAAGLTLHELAAKWFVVYMTAWRWVERRGLEVVMSPTYKKQGKSKIRWVKNAS